MIRRETILFFLIPALLIGPTVVILAAYAVTKNPTLRPLGVTLERLIAAGEVDNAHITVSVRVGDRAKMPAPRDEFEKALHSAFRPFNTEVSVEFIDVPGSTSATVTYIVGNSRIGPFSPNRAAEGIGAAAEAERMLVAHRKAKRIADAKARQNGPWWQRVFAE